MSDSQTARDVTETSEVLLTVPAQNRYLRLVRLVASGLAADVGFDVDAIEDIRLGIDELCLLALDGAGGTLQLAMRADAHALEIAGTMDGAPRAEDVPDLSRQILDVVADEHELSSSPDGTVRFRLRKRYAL